MTKKSIDTDHYRTLKIPEAATQKEIKQAYRRLAKELHPDTQTAPAGHEGIQQINAAYEVLGDPQQRSRYDQQRRLHKAGFESDSQIRDRTHRLFEHCQADRLEHFACDLSQVDAVAAYVIETTQFTSLRSPGTLAFTIERAGDRFGKGSGEVLFNIDSVVINKVEQ